jgi:hypothetical protein
MAHKTAVWAAFQQFSVSDIDVTVKRAPGDFAQKISSEQPAVVERPGRRPRSTPPRPLSLEPSFAFHHKEFPENERMRAPMLGCRQPSGYINKVDATIACELFKCASFEVLPVSKRAFGQFSPQASGTGTTTVKSTVVGDFHVRGVIDIDHISRRGAGIALATEETAADMDCRFCEEQGEKLRRSIKLLTQEDECEASEIVYDLSKLGIECRRLQRSQSTNLASQMKASLLSVCEDAGTTRLASAKSWAPVLAARNSAKTETVKPGHASRSVDDGLRPNVNMRRLQHATKSTGWQTENKTKRSPAPALSTVSTTHSESPKLMENVASHQKLLNIAENSTKVLDKVLEMQRNATRKPSSICSTQYVASEHDDSDADNFSESCWKPQS